MKLELDNEFGPLHARFLNILLKSIVKSHPSYQPVIFNNRQFPIQDRNCFDRWDIIKSELANGDVHSLVDLGCAEGFFVRKAASEFNCFSLGIDADVRRLLIAESTNTLDRNFGSGFMLSNIDESLLERLPKFDLVVFFSVMHHIMYEHGVEYSKNLLQKIRNKVEKVMFFEMGQSNETSSSWAKLLPDMGDDPHEWIASFLYSSGFKKVEKVASSDSYGSSISRAVFRLEP